MRFEVDIAVFAETGRDAIALLDVLLAGVEGPEPERFVVHPQWLRRGECASEAERIVEILLRSA